MYEETKYTRKNRMKPAVCGDPKYNNTITIAQ